MDLVQSSNGTTQRDVGGYTDQPRGGQTSGQKHKILSKRGKKEKSLSLVPSHFTQTDVSGVKGESRIFLDMMFCILCSNIVWARVQSIFSGFLK